MEPKYFCPKCKANLNPSRKVVFCIGRETTKCLVLLDPVPGDYTKFVPEGITLKEGDVWNFYCPVCSANLSCDEEHKLACVDGTGEDGKEHKLIFSRRVGTLATFIIEGDEIKGHGPHSEKLKPIVKEMYFSWRV